ncbi:MAG: radical SAM protein [Chloroflexi bacterium]|nr:radical SAM protein [Chloroflexota bacterium]
MPGAMYSFFVQWHLTERCNLRCRHCYQEKVAGELEHQEICQAMEGIAGTIQGWRADYGMEISPSFHFTGGEPMVRHGLFPILAQAHSLGFSVSLMSNGTLISEELARRLATAGVRDVQVSLDGLEDVHDSIRGKGSFQQAVRGIANLISAGVETNINLTLSRVNYDQLDGLVNLGKQLGVGAVAFSRLVPCGRGEELADEVLTPAELSDLHAKARALNAGSKVEVACSDPLFSVTGIPGEVPQIDFPVGGCAAGMFGVTITSDGSVMPCRRMNLVIGNIKQQSLRELWADSPVLWALRDRRSYHDGCESCYYWAVCRGCRAIALASARSNGQEDFLGADPQCPYHKPRG